MAEPGVSTNRPPTNEPRTITLAAELIDRFTRHARKDVNASGNSAVATMREGIQLAMELCRRPAETPSDPNPNLENRLVDMQALLDGAEREVEIANGNYEQMRAERDRLQNELQQSQRNLTQALALATRAPEQRPPPPPQVEEVPRPEHEVNRPVGQSTKYPDAPMFSGRVRTELRPFIAKLRLKLHFNRDRYSGEQDKLAYAVQRLEDLALAQIIPFVANHRIDLPDVDALITILENAFGDPDRVATAERELNKLRQTNREFSLYYAEFQRLVAELDYNEAAKKNALRRGLSEELKDTLAQNPNQPEDLQQFVHLCNRLDNQIRARKAEKRGDDYRPRPAPVTAPRGAPAAAPAPASAPAPTPHPTNTNSGSYGAAPMDLSANRRRNTPEERQKCMAEGRCLNCHGFGHLARECPGLGRRPGGNRAPVRANEAVVGPIETPTEAETSGNGGANE